MKKRRKAAVDEKGVEVAVLVVVEPGDAGAHGLEIEALRRRGALVAEVDARLARDVAKLDVVRIGLGAARGRLLREQLARCDGDAWQDEFCERGGGEIRRSDQKGGESYKRQAARR